MNESLSLSSWLENRAKHGRRLLNSPGIVITAQHEENFTFSTSGYARVSRKEPFGPDTQFRIGSINKVFTSVILKLLELKGKINFSDPIQKYLPYLKFYSKEKLEEPVRIKHLLTHTSGLGEFRTIRDFFDPNLALATKSESKYPPLSKYYSRPLALYHPPGTSWYYANHGFGILGALIEGVAGKPYPEVAKEMLFDPLGMKRTVILNSETKPPIATGYMVKKNRGKSVINPNIIPLAAGNAWSTATDMMKFSHELIKSFHGNSTIFDQTLARDLFKPWFQISPHITQMGLGIFLLPTTPLIAHHGGTISGFNSILLISPEERLSLIAAINRINRDLFFSYSLHTFQKLHRQIGKPIRDSFYLSPNFQIDSPPSIHDLPVSFSIGTFNLALSRIILGIGTKVTIDRHNTCLTVRGNGPLFSSPNVLLFIRECEKEYHFGIPDASRKTIQRMTLTKNLENIYLDLFGIYQFRKEKKPSLRKKIGEFLFYSFVKAFAKK